jgi:transcriptional regulator with XRE-family HTH domain
MDVNASDMMHSLTGLSSTAIRRRIGRRAKEARLIARRSQADVARAAGVSLPTLQRFEAGDNVGIDCLVRVAIALEAETGLASLFPKPDVRSLDEIIERNRVPKRGRSR